MKEAGKWNNHKGHKDHKAEGTNGLMNLRISNRYDPKFISRP